MFVITILISNSYSQNYKPLVIGNKYNYIQGNNDIITTTIWIDSIKLSGGDSVYYLNRIITNCDSCSRIADSYPSYEICDTCIALQNQPQFLQRMIITDPHGTWNFKDTDT